MFVINSLLSVVGILNGFLTVSGLSVLNIGTIKEVDGCVDRNFWLRNDGTESVVLLQGYTSCGCTTIEFDKDSWVQPGDSTLVSLHFNPRGKGGEFYESGTIGYSTSVDGERQRVQIALEGDCITSEETLLKQHPVKVCEGLRISSDYFNLGYMQLGQTKDLFVSVLHQNENNRTELLPVHVSTDGLPKGKQVLEHKLQAIHNGKKQTISIKLDIYIK